MVDRQRRMEDPSADPNNPPPKPALGPVTRAYVRLMGRNLDGMKSPNTGCLSLDLVGGVAEGVRNWRKNGPQS